MRRLMLLLLLLPALASAQSHTTTTAPYETWSSRVIDANKHTFFRFLGESDEAVTTMEIDNQGQTTGTGRSGYTELSLRAQDEIRDAGGVVLSSSDLRGGLRMFANSWGYVTDPRVGVCVDVHCPNTLEIFSNRSIAMTSDSHQPIYAIVGNALVWSLEKQPDGGPSVMRLPTLRLGAPLPQVQGAKYPACVDDAGVLMRC